MHRTCIDLLANPHVKPKNTQTSEFKFKNITYAQTILGKGEGELNQIKMKSY